jgi:hypothetical protein
MDFTRRDLTWILPILAVVTGKAAGSALPCKFYAHEDLPVAPQAAAFLRRRGPHRIQDFAA